MIAPENRSFEVSGQFVDIHQRRIFPSKILVQDGKISNVVELTDAPRQFILPGFVDSHVHVESSMLVPSEFARLAVIHGTVATISDPHEIGNVLGVEGVKFMIENGKQVPFKFCFGAPSCVPATVFETAGAEINLADVKELLAMPEIGYLAEMMNFPGVLHSDEEVMGKIRAAKEVGKPVDGHAPGLRGDDARNYFAAGISTDHECFQLDEAQGKAKLGVKILIREGSAAKNFEALHPIISEFPDLAMFCSDDKHPDGLLLGHVNRSVARAVAKGHDLFDVLRAACLNPVLHYKLNVGLLREGDPADFIVAKDLQDFDILATYINGELVAENGNSLIPHYSSAHPNRFHSRKIEASDLQVRAFSAGAPYSLLTRTDTLIEPKTEIRVIVVEDGQLITKETHVDLTDENGLLISDTAQDILKIVVVNRYENAPPAVAFVQNFGLKAGAIAGSVAHDSHNIIAVGVSDEDLAAAINLVMESKGGLSLANGKETLHLPLPVAGLMTDRDGFEVAEAYTRLDKRAKELGATLASPYMTLSFCALLVIPELKLSDKGLFDGRTFRFTSLYTGAEAAQA